MDRVVFELLWPLQGDLFCLENFRSINGERVMSLALKIKQQLQTNLAQTHSDTNEALNNSLDYSQNGAALLFKILYLRGGY